MSEIEQQFDAFLPDPTQDLALDLSPDERKAANDGVRHVVEDICSNPEMSFSIAAVLNAVTRTYEPELQDPRFKLSVAERDARDQWTRGVIAGLSRARQYLTNPRYAGELLKLLQPETETED